MRTVIETPSFQKQASEVWSKEEREAFIDWIAEHPDAGDVIKDADGARKVRWSRKGTGKSGGVRVIYYHLVDDEVVLLLMLYAKAVRETVKGKEIKDKRSKL
ncbi:DNA-binding protein [Alcaligenes endophyticus]|uniref:DNA-binding protein n=1 Tax=Alcaligenes endophyticus TaxID=1929088 RepID=A0ABT8EJ09_9BURK|nr:DNA-binding protein [Alcaligenes endophyticus]MCX5592540.1 DNA-binding protein [Alcaligenes endophyticus]MDN4121266.1 DNA-binding protein [Alcaligenes endophyticus]